MDLPQLLRAFTVWEAAAVLRHDVRNKLASVRNAAFYLRRKITVEAAEVCDRDPRIPKFFELIKSEVDAADTMLSERMPALVREAVLTEIDLAAVARDAAAALAIPGAIALALPEAPVAARGVHRELAVAVMCLIENAIDAIVDGDGGAITVACTRDGEGAVIAVVDDGPGLPADLAARAAEPFVSSRPGRLGLGLAVARRLAGRSNARLEVGDREGARGVRAALVLPT